MVGLILCDRSLSIWRCDRSGNIGTLTKINIDKVCQVLLDLDLFFLTWWQEPLKFIRVIASFRLLSPERLGYDPTMKLFPRDRPSSSGPVTAVVSYSPALSKEDLPTSRHDMCWEISIDGKRYRTIRTLSASSSEVMNGRATIVWLGIRLEDHQVRHPFVPSCVVSFSVLDRCHQTELAPIGRR